MRRWPAIRGREELAGAVVVKALRGLQAREQLVRSREGV
jgi:hypothetical protein